MKQLKEIHNNKEHCNALFQFLFKDYKNVKIDAITNEKDVEFIRIVGDSEFVKDLVLFIHYNGYIECGISRWISEDLYWELLNLMMIENGLKMYKIVKLY